MKRLNWLERLFLVFAFFLLLSTVGLVRSCRQKAEPRQPAATKKTAPEPKTDPEPKEDEWEGREW